MTAADRDRIVTAVRGIVAMTRLPDSNDARLTAGLSQDQVEAELAVVLEVVQLRLLR